MLQISHSAKPVLALNFKSRSLLPPHLARGILHFPCILRSGMDSHGSQGDLDRHRDDNVCTVYWRFLVKFVTVLTTVDMNGFHPTRDASVAEHSRKNLSTSERPKSPCIIWIFSTNCHFNIYISSSNADGTKIHAEVQLWCAESLEGDNIRNQMGSHRWYCSAEGTRQ